MDGLMRAVRAWLPNQGVGPHGFGELAQHKLITTANEINCLMSDSKVPIHADLILPQLVVIGTQSSGKSSILNRLMNIDLLPTGSSMVTRTPLNLCLHKVTSEPIKSWVEFKQFDAGTWTTYQRIDLTLPTPQPEEIQRIRDTITQKTNEYAGTEMGVSDKPIIVNLYSPNVPNLSLVDLPGFIMIPCTEKGQPSDIQHRIEKLVDRYVSNPKSIVLTVIQARTDLETDQGLAFIKRYPEAGYGRMIGVLTKPDLMNEGSDVSSYLSGNIASDLRLSEGYYTVRNASTVEESNAIEAQWFEQHSVYSSYPNCTGIPSLCNHVVNLLTSSINQALPEVVEGIGEVEKVVDRKLSALGEQLPESDESKIVMLNHMVRKISQRVISLLEDRGLDISYGSSLKSVFCKYRKSVSEHHLFTDDIQYPSHYFTELIRNFEGNHMSFSVPHVEVLECCIRDDRKRPFQHLVDISRQTVDQIRFLLSKTVGTAIDDIVTYRGVKIAMMDAIVEPMLILYQEEMYRRINDLVKDQTSYVWSDDADFRRVLQEAIQTPLNVSSEKSEFNELRRFLEAYYQTVKFCFGDMVPKMIMKGMVLQMEENLYHSCYQYLVAESRIDLLQEDDEVAEARKKWVDLRRRIERVKDIISS